jgi:hypothetical protein
MEYEIKKLDLDDDGYVVATLDNGGVVTNHPHWKPISGSHYYADLFDKQVGDGVIIPDPLSESQKAMLKWLVWYVSDRACDEEGNGVLSDWQLDLIDELALNGLDSSNLTMFVAPKLENIFDVR